jgi:hypothetical protein
MAVTSLDGMERAKLSMKSQASCKVLALRLAAGGLTITDLLAQRLRPDSTTVFVSDRGLRFRRWRNSIFACIRPVVAEDDNPVRRTLPCFVESVLQAILLQPEEVEDN